MLDFRLSEQQLELQQKARQFALEQVLPIAAYYDEKDEVPIDVLRAAYEAGISSTDIPEKYGGKGYGILEGVIVTEEIAAACPGIATSVFDNSLGMEPLILCDNEPLKEKYLSRMAREFQLMSFATSEPGMGSDVSGIRCTATPDGEDYILNGTKYWVTNGGIADYYSIFATVDPKSQHEGICAFLVERDWEGVSVGRAIPKMGQRSSNTAGIHFDNVRVPKENVLAEPGQGFYLAMKTFSRTRPVIGAFSVGAARSAMEYAIEYVKKRRAFGTKIANFQSLQFKIAEMYQKVETSRLLTLKAAWEADSGMDPTIDASVAKFYASEAALEVANEALQIFGGFGYTKMFPVEKLLRDIRLFRIYEGTSEIQRMIVSGHALNTYQPVMPAMEDLPLHLDKDPEGVNQADDPASTAWRCRICGYVHYGQEPPEQCPFCFFPAASFKNTAAQKA
ncbi:MAG TPA: acyl-CoA dehydrogenase family protein [Desulfosalsimonadaceae bacterium]|nr:acyl-CoA dehydrogenase family protein [Desulfosalsimonadaceae bacterium]